MGLALASGQFQVVFGPGDMPFAAYQDGNNDDKLTLRRFQTSCDASFAPSNGVGTPCTYDLPVGRSCVASCDSGYVGSGSRTCKAGIVLEDSFKCDPLPCNGSVPVENGIPDGCREFLASGQSCTPTCNPGYTASGVRSCMAGTLSGFECLPDPCDASGSVENGFSGDCGSFLASGHSCTPACKANYTGIGVRKCLAGRIIDEFTCVPFPCDASKDPENGVAFPCTAVLASNGRCVPTCNRGWGPSGFRNCSSGSLIDNFKCIHAPCDSSDPPLHGSVGNCSNALPSGEICVPACDSASGLVPSGYRSCYMGVLTNTFACVQPDLSAFTTRKPMLEPTNKKASFRTVSSSSEFNLV